MTGVLPARRIVVGVDGTAAATAAVLWAVHEARLRHAAVHLIRACDRDSRFRAPYACSTPERGRDEHVAAARAELDAAAQLARDRLTPDRVIAELADELPARALLTRAAGAEMLVLGTSLPAIPAAGHPDSLGAVARACLEKAPCPVVIVSAGAVAARLDDARRSRGSAQAARIGTPG